MVAVKALVIISLSVLLSAPLSGVAQTGRTLRLAILDNANETARVRDWQVFRARLEELGYTGGKNLVIEARYARGANERLLALAAELVALKPDIIVAAATISTQAAMQATSTIPIVFTGVADPVASGLVTSFARPGGNATGLSTVTPDLGPKWLELLHEIAPGAKRVAYLTDTGSVGGVLVFKRMQEQARKLDLTIEMFDGQQPKELQRSLEAIARQRFAGLIVGATAKLFEHREQIVRFAAEHKLPAIYAHREYAEAGAFCRTVRTSVEYIDAPRSTFTGSHSAPNRLSCRWSALLRFEWC